MLKAYKYRIYPNNEQVVYLAKTFGCARFIYNQMLHDAIEEYKATGKSKINTPASYKDKFAFLKEVDSLALANAQLNLQGAYKKFFAEKQAGFPNFKSKRNHYYSYTTNNQNGTIYIKDGYIKVPKLKSLIKIKLHRQFDGTIRSATISKTPTNKYFVSLLVEEEVKQLPKATKQIGIDLGLKSFAVCSGGATIENPKWLRNTEYKVKKCQRSLARKKLGSNSYHKNRLKLAKLHEKLANQRKDFLHKLSTSIVSENQTIVIEDLKVKNMLQNHRLAKAISEVSWSMFRSLLTYKSTWYGRDLIIAPKNYASSQLCSECGHKNPDVKNLNIREWTCPSCGAVHDRDHNASKNLLKLAV